MKQQKFFNANEDFALISSIANKLKLSEKVVELLFSRGINTEQKINKFFTPTFSDFNNPFLLNGMEEAKKKLLDAINNNEKILIFGDYDVDGVSATAIILKLLEKLNYSANYFLPNRFIDGYGLTKQSIDKVKEKFNPKLIITVDCGISCYEEVEYAKQLGIDVIVTDHHEIPEKLPNSIIINPKMPNQNYPFKELCGTGVAFKFAQAVLNDICEDMLPIAAIATIADIVSLTEENRAIVSLGLNLFEKYLPIGIKELLKDNKISIKTLNSTDIAFKIAPKLNSSGRMGEASDSLKLYLEQDIKTIKELIEKINEYNLNRQKACSKVYEDCIKMLNKTNMANENSIILYSNQWDSGILGIVCSRLVENFNRPTFLFSEENGILHGSARSIQDVNVHEILSNMKDILETFGGHKMAAGMCLKKEHFSKFKQNVNNFIISKVSNKAFLPIMYYDLEIEEKHLTEKFLEDINKLEPFGLNNSKPLLKISTQQAKVTPLKNFASHYNITIGKLSLIYFNCLEKYFSLKYSIKKNIIFEIQNKQGSQIKGIVKDFDSGFEFDKSFSSTLDAYCFEQLKYLENNKKVSLNSFNQGKLIEIIANCEKSVFGTIFIATKTETYKNFVENFSCDNIFELFVFNNSSNTGYNAIYLFPTNLNIFKNYKTIVFLDGVLDKTYLKEIRKISNGEIYVPEQSNFNKKLFASLNLSRKEIGSFFVNLKKLNNSEFLNISHFYNIFSKENKISFNNFYMYILILNELKIISLDSETGLFLKIDENRKTELNKSKIFNTVSFIKQIIRG